jgi:hypothetical protein
LTVRSDELLGCAEVGDGLLHLLGVAVGEGVVDDDPLDQGDAAMPLAAKQALAQVRNPA